MGRVPEGTRIPRPFLIAELSGEVTRRIKTSNTGRKRLGVCLTASTIRDLRSALKAIKSGIEITVER